MDIKIKPIDDSTYKEAVRIAVEGDTDDTFYAQQWLKNYDRYYVAMNKNRVVGEIGWYQDDGTLSGKVLGDKFPHGNNNYWISHFAVDKRFRNKGIGGLLFKYIEKVVKEKGAKELWVYTDTAQEFYLKHGFTFVAKGEVDDYIEEIFKKELK
jgi:GNAT superfamily N-acetyltransferase